jgi:hypothetical protein
MSYESLKWLHIIFAMLVLSGVMVGAVAALALHLGRHQALEVIHFSNKLQGWAVIFLTLPGLFALLASGMQMAKIATYDLQDWWLSAAFLNLLVLLIYSAFHYVILLRSEERIGVPYYAQSRIALFYYAYQISILIYIVHLMVCKPD